MRTIARRTLICALFSLAIGVLAGVNDELPPEATHAVAHGSIPPTAVAKATGEIARFLEAAPPAQVEALTKSRPSGWTVDPIVGEETPADPVTAAYDSSPRPRLFRDLVEGSEAERAEILRALTENPEPALLETLGIIDRLPPEAAEPRRALLAAGRAIASAWEAGTQTDLFGQILRTASRTDAGANDVLALAEDEASPEVKNWMQDIAQSTPRLAPDQY